MNDEQLKLAQQTLWVREIDRIMADMGVKRKVAVGLLHGQLLRYRRPVRYYQPVDELGIPDGPREELEPDDVVAEQYDKYQREYDDEPEDGHSEWLYECWEKQMEEENTHRRVR